MNSDFRVSQRRSKLVDLYVHCSLSLRTDAAFPSSSHEQAEDAYDAPLPNPTPEPEPLYNPYQDNAEPSYIRIETAGGVIYKHATAGAIVEKPIKIKTRWQKLREENQLENGGSVWGRWGNKVEWEDAYWMVMSKTSQRGLEDLLKTERVSVSSADVQSDGTIT